MAETEKSDLKCFCTISFPWRKWIWVLKVSSSVVPYWSLPRKLEIHAHTHCVPFHILKKFFNQILLEKITIQNKYLIINDKEWIIKQALAILSFPLIFLLHLIYLLCVHMCMPNKSHGMCVEVRGQLVGVGSLLPTCGSLKLDVDPRLGNKGLYPLSHLAGPQF